MNRRVLVVWLLLVFGLVWWSAAVENMRPRLVLNAYPMIGFSPLKVRLRAEIKGDLTEEWMCPEVVWEMPDGSVAKELSDCDESTEPPRVWTREATIETLAEQAVPFTIKLYRNDRLLAKQTVEVRVQG
jgi:hypothetical protein